MGVWITAGTPEGQQWPVLYRGLARLRQDDQQKNIKSVEKCQSSLALSKQVN
ncbi:hypothetical protein ABENE_10135 [Asticcacaulis benevestitus DSM 16100 = ATCC BAA-896]|uniref:Uncharacterized protein n=1 Tax=Asticcacaulis benevestitus DSM 16100 = ATCC BAA-896 TaxID=1121022 RepID=V4PVC8_9CAUL|nr:hypothetical protein ABENE_10135 [Asticcacaulis benevestitus DSM 16100 = ATCC BAA-896]